MERTQTLVYNLIYTMLETDDPLNAVVRIQTFSTEKAAMDTLEAEYDDMVKSIEDGNTILDCVRKENNGNNARIDLGYESQYESDAVIPEVETRHEWRVAKTTIDLHA